MADDLIHCPSCGFQLRLPTELYGTAVECPQCHSRFTAPAPAARPAAMRPPPGREYDANARSVPDDYEVYAKPVSRAAAALKTPAILLIVLAGLVVLQCLWGAISAEKTIADFKDQANSKDLPPQLRDFMQQMTQVMTFEFVVGSNLAIAAVSLVTILGGIQMLRLRTYWLAVIGVVFGLNPVSCPCCMAQVPIAIWGLVVLFRTDVRAAFR
jgi:hypothetical protein